ncbi:nuclear transport factor 2 family protein [Nocardiopsis aegyptia]|uniref:nuclear transport factor 2 family protein n=1 Tax=Nocardiopsis aegyptia TaxID=220378 RepID=UPI0036725214
MTTRSESSGPFDLSRYTRAVERKDADTMVSMFAEDADFEMIDRRTPPSSPAVLHGRDAIAPVMRDISAREMTHEIVNVISDGEHVAYTERCTYPDDTRVMSMTMLDLSDGRIKHQSTIQAWDDDSGRAMQVGDFGMPDDTDDYENAHTDLVQIGGRTVARMTLQPGWRWSEHARPIQGTDLCMKTHRAFIISGTICGHMSDGSELEATAGQTAFVPPGHDAWVVGDEPCVLLDWGVGE